MKKIVFVIIAFSIILTGCLLRQDTTQRDVFLKGKVKNTQEKSVLILQFAGPSYDLRIGKRAAEIFHQEMLKANKFGKVVLNNDYNWLVKFKDEETSIKAALKYAREKEFSLLFLGWVEKAVYGRLTDTEVIIKVRLIDTKTLKTLWYERDRKRTKPKDRSYPLETKLSTPLPPLEETIRFIARKQISSMLADKKVKSFFKLWEKRDK